MEKQERMKKIVTRGDDRMALITGRIQTLEADPLPKSTSFSISSPPQHIRSASEPLSVEEHSLIRTNVISEFIDDSGGSRVSDKKVERKLTRQQINFSIISTEDTRSKCSIMLAVFVFFYHANLPQDETKPNSLITYCPIYVLLLTDVAIVVSKLYAQIANEDEDPQVGDDGEWGGAVQLLEIGLVVYQTIRAIFIDCSLYIVIVVFGLSHK